jgi:PAS domain S-box-containing protein
MDWNRALDLWPEMLTRTTLDGVYTFVSEASNSMLGFSPREMLGRHAVDFLHPDDMGALARHTDDLRRSGRASSPITVRVRRADGSYLHLETVSVIVDDEGRPAVLTSSRDVTDRLQREARLGAAEARYRALFDSLPQGVLMLAPDGSVESVNVTAEHLLGRSAAGLVGRPVPAALNPEGLPATGEDVRERIVAWPDRSSGKKRPLSVRWQPLRRHGERTPLSMAVLVSSADAAPTDHEQGSGIPVASGPLVGLTPREREVLTLLAEGYDVRQIATRLQVQLSTVRGYVKSLLGKFGVHSQLQVVVLARRAGLIGNGRAD